MTTEDCEHRHVMQINGVTKCSKCDVPLPPGRCLKCHQPLDDHHLVAVEEPVCPAVTP